MNSCICYFMWILPCCSIKKQCIKLALFIFSYWIIITSNSDDFKRLRNRKYDNEMELSNVNNFDPADSRNSVVRRAVLWYLFG